MNESQEIRIQPSYSRWLTEEVFNLIDLVRNDEAIYNPRHKYYFCRPYVENFWREIDLRLRKNSGASLAKWTNLRISFRREYANFQEEKVPPCWTYFDRMLFLHPYLRNKKSSDPPKGIDPHIQEALAQISNLSYKSQQQASTSTPTTSDSPVNEYMDQYLSYCEDDPQPSPDDIDDIIEDDNQGNSHNRIQSNDLKSDSDNENEDKDQIQMQEHDDYKDIIIEISDDASNPSQTELKQLSPQNECVNSRSLIKRPRTDLGNIAMPSSSNNISLVRPLTTASHPPVEVNNMFHQAIVNSSQASNSNRGEQLGSPTSASTSVSTSRRSEFCECKTDSDAMFLMSLLPDIRKLNGRDRGKIKIAFQNIVQEFLYPD
ncbi:uncharacterized protein LOC129918471 [Episyrphus balteatus]|uniref:uncharacterized protein LOC129918471 n=1 Tax=Episyrphus balteatus TaxID=286459 RepID=UPI002485E20E|nr:uncharacterized protein LOC129918471 [Episyrphus balteatus]